MLSPLRWLTRGAGLHTPLPPEGEGGRIAYCLVLVPLAIGTRAASVVDPALILLPR